MSEKKSNAPEHDAGQETGQADHGHEPQVSKRLTLVASAIILLLIIYGALISQGLPQKWTEISNTPHHAAEHHDEAHSGDVVPGSLESASSETPVSSPEVSEAHKSLERPHHPPYFMIAPFAILLLCIAILPLIPATEHWWEKNSSRFLVAAVLGLITLAYYALACNFPVDLHWPGHRVVDPETDGKLAAATAIFINAIVADYIPFIVLLFSLFTISGGIRIEGDLKASPFVNSVILLIGAALASIVGTTGAAMLLIRLLLETNQQRKYRVHTVVMFIFCVCNCGGCLTPLGDPPLFLGYLKGIDFMWTFFALWPAWLFVNFILIGFYFLWDTLWFYPRESKEDKAVDKAAQTGLKISGLGLNLPLLAGVVLAVALLAPTKTVPGTEWYPWMFLREAVQLGLCAISLLFGSRALRKANSFNFLAIGEVAALFFGIFICMQVPLQILNFEGKNLVESVQAKTGVKETQLFFWSTGALSSVLDNAPTYVVFMETAKSLSPNTEEELKKDPKWKDAYEKGEMITVGNSGFIDHYLLVAIALGAVFMGSMTYIGNGPNFMVKAIAEQSGVKMPSFFGYMVYSCLILLPILIVMTLIFL